MADRFQEYVRTVQEQIRWKRARAGLEDELRTHLLDQRDACMAEGMTREEAEAESLRQMGDPVEVGARLDRVHRPRPQWGLVALVSAVLMIGAILQQTVMTQQAELISYMESYAQTYWLRWLMMALAGEAVMLVVYVLDYTLLGRHPLALYGLGVAGLLVVFPMCPILNGKRYGMDFYLLASPVLMALLLYAMRGKGWRGYFLSLLGIEPFPLMALLVPSVSCAVLLAGTGFVLLMVTAWKGWLGIPQRKGVAATLGIAAAGGVAALCRLRHNAYVINRIQVAFHPEMDPLGMGYWICKVRELLRGAKWIGQGTYQGERLENISKVLSTGATDNFLTWTIHRYGWLIGLAMVGLLVLLLVWMGRKARKQQGMLGRLVSTAVVCVLSIQVLIYAAANLGSGLMGGISLPLLSWGRQVQVVNMALIGLALSVFREERLPVKEQRSAGKRDVPVRPLVVWQDGDLVIRVSQWKRVRE